MCWFKQWGSVIVIMLVIAFLAEGNTTTALAQESTYFLGKIQLNAERSVISIEENIYGLSIDTSVSPGEKADYPNWMFIGDLKVDSIFYENSRVQLMDSTQLHGINIYSDTLLGLFSDAKVYCLTKMFPDFSPEDTLYWDSVRVRWHTLPDMSKFYKICFPEEIDIDSLANNILSIVGIGEAQGIGIPISDADPCTLFVPNDPYFPSAPTGYIPGWHHNERDPVTLEGGCFTRCAWGLMVSKYSLGAGFISVIDRGIYLPHEDLSDKFVGNYGDTNCYQGCDHGTKIAGVAAAVTDNDVGVAGIAPDANLISFSMDVDTFAYQTFWRAIADTVPTTIINYSYHSSMPSAALCSVLVVAKAKNIPVVVAAGNFNGPTLYPPQTVYPAAWDSLVITVGAHSYYGNVASLSNYPCDTCPKWLDVVAPGWLLTSTETGGGYGTNNGTSIATPVVAGVLALAKAINPSLTPEVLENILENTSDPTLDPVTADSLALGHGRVDAQKFIEYIINTTAPITMKSSSLSDSVPCLIITKLAHQSTLQPLADKKTNRGSNTKIEVIESISLNYSGGDLQEKIRACIKDYYDTKHLEYVILAGDGTVVPYRYAYNNLYGPGINAICDYYYACLDGDWNSDQDTLWGEIEDNTDLEPEVAVGRLPFSTNQEFSDFIAKLDVYEGGLPSGWQARAAAIGSEMFYPTDSKGMCQDILSQLPSGFATTELYDDTVINNNRQNYFSLMNSGQGIVIKYGLAQISGNFCVNRSPYTFVYNADIDTLANYDMPSVIYAATCWNSKYDEDCMAEHYIGHSTGGAIAYIGTTFNDYVLVSDEMAISFFNQLFGSGPKEIGKLLNLGKQTLVDNSDWDGADRHTMFGYSLSGDPQMRIWTDNPQFLTQTCPDQLETGVQSFTVTIESQGGPIEGSLVCLSMGDDVYELEYTDANGIASFTNVDFSSSGNAYVVASKYNYVDIEDTISIVQPSGCPMLYLDVNGDHVFINNILAASEDISLADQNNADYYPIYDIPVGQGDIIGLTIAEDESERTFLDELAAEVVTYPSDKQLVYTNKHEFRLMTGTSYIPTSAYDHNETDILPLVSAQDGKCYTAESAGYIVLKYEFPAVFLKPTDDGPGGGIDPGGGNKNQWKVLAGSSIDDYRSQNVTISVLDEGDSWIPIDVRYPRINEYKFYTDLGEFVANNSVTVKISWDNEISIDAVPYEMFDNDPVPMTTLTMPSVNHSSNGDITGFISNTDQSEILLNPGETINVEMSQFPNQPGLKAALALKFVGRYSTIDLSNDDGTTFEQNYPNPFNPSTRFAFSLAQPEHVELTIFNVLGQRVTTLADDFYPAGRHVINWDGTDGNGQRVASGIYFSSFSAGEYHSQKKLMMIK